MSDTERLRELAGKATPGPWVAQRSDTPGHQPGWYIDTHASAEGPEPVWAPPQHPVSEADAELIVAAVNALPGLLDRLRDLETALREYGEHSPGCVNWRSADCDCGLRAVLRGSEASDSGEARDGD